MQKQERKRYSVDQVNQCKALYYTGWLISHIAEEMNISRSTIERWRKSGRWDESTVMQRVSSSIEARYIQLLYKEKKSNGDYKELEALDRRLKNLARIQHYADTGRESELSPGIKARNEAPRKERTNPNFFTDEQIRDLEQSLQEMMFGYQRRWYDNRKQRGRFELKGRQLGATFFRGCESLLDALDTGHNEIFISASKRQAFEFKQKMSAWVEDVTNKKLFGGDEIELQNKARLIYLGTNFRSVQGYTGNVTVDEAFWISNFTKVYEAAKAMATQKQYSVSLLSTASFKTHEAYAYWTGEYVNKGRPDSEKLIFDMSDEALKNGVLGPDLIWRNRVTVYDAVEMGCDLIDIEQLRLGNSPELFANKYMCEFMDGQDSVFKFDELQRCLVDADVVWTDYKRLTSRPFAGRPVWVGVDSSYSGEHSDHSCIVVMAPPETPKGKFRLLELIELKQADFETQAAAIKAVHKKYNMQHLVIDVSGGYGKAVFELVKGFFPRVTGLTYNIDLKSQMVLKAQSVLKNRRLEYDAGYSQITRSFLSIRRALTASQKQVTFETGRSEEAGHGDAAWAIMQVLRNEPLDAERASERKSILVIG